MISEQVLLLLQAVVCSRDYSSEMLNEVRKPKQILFVPPVLTLPPEMPPVTQIRVLEDKQSHLYILPAHWNRAPLSQTALLAFLCQSYHLGCRVFELRRRKKTSMKIQGKRIQSYRLNNKCITILKWENAGSVSLLYIYSQVL